MTTVQLAAPRTRRTEWLVLAGLILLSIIPVIGGGLRLSELAAGAEVTADNARFVHSPVPVVVHAVSGITYLLLGAFQFVPGIRRRRPAWHRRAGRVLIPSGLVLALSGLWMTLFYDLPAFDLPVTNAARLVFGTAMAIFLVLGFAAVRRRDITAHRAWMVRAYAIAQGAGTQALTMLPLMVTDQMDVPRRTVLMIGSWVINLAIAEWIVRKL